MGCQSEVFLGDNLVFSIGTHDPDTGVATDADADPPYRLYEDETAVPILTGTMSLLDAVNTIGFYTELIAVTAANGFEARRTYTVYIEAAVGGDTGVIPYSFTVLEPWECAGCIPVTITVTVGGLPVDGVDVDISTDVGKTNVVWCGVTDAFGVARDETGSLPCLDAGTYYVWKSHSDYIFTNPVTIVVS